MTIPNEPLHTHDHPHADVAVVGGGLAGLVAATTAARAGASVVVLDARSVGGRARSATRDGYTLNEGGHALYQGAGGRAILDGLGVRIDGNRPPTSSYRTVWDGEIAPLPATPAAILTSRLLGTRSKVKLGGWFSNMAKAAAGAGDRSVEEWLDDQRAGADLRKYLVAMMRLSTYSARPETQPASAMLGQFVAGADGVRYLHGGWQTIVDELVRIAGDAGVAVVEHEPVVHVESVGTRWQVSTSARTVDAASVVFASGGPSLAVGLLAADAAEWVERAGPVQRAACLDLGTATPGDVAFLLSADEPLYLSAHAPVARLAPTGRHLTQLMRYLTADDPLSSTENRAALEGHAARARLPASDREVDRFLAAPVVTWGSPQVGIERPTGLELAERGITAAGDWVGDRLLADASIVSGEAAGIAAARRASVMA